jgi:SepF-like predicted cell division protein (DUF552 family)
MTLKDVMKSISGAFSRVTADMTRRPDGGTSHYRPLRKKNAEPQQGDMTQGMGQAPQYVHTGFTGMNPPADGGYGQGTGYYGQGTGYYGQPAGQGQQVNPVSYFTRSNETAAEMNYVGKGSFTGQQSFIQNRRSNISYMPGVAPGIERGQMHIEHIITLTGLKSCYEAIECMKDGETLIVMLDAIANESESIRCQDMLAGAAFTLGCTVRLLPGARIVIIAPEGVKILPEQAAAAMAPVMQQPQRGPMPAADPQQPVRRERRTSANASQWEAARNGELDGYNPYTGTMPVAAGSYASFGGYGY